MNVRRQRWIALGTSIIFGGALLTSSCQRIGSLDSIELISDEDGAPAQALNQPTAGDLATALDSLERGIESDGSVVAEQPSVWGQARLTMYRQEFETTMAAMLNKFQFTLQGSLNRSDQAYAADALALSYAAQAASLGSSGSGLTPATASSSASSSGGSGASSSPSGSTSTSGAAPSSPFSYDPSTTAFGAFSNMSRTGVSMPTPLAFAGASNGISLEPTVYLDQMKRYIDHLHELRRMSDGDDTADSPGYSLNLIRIPVSVLPGRRTQQRYGAEITLTMKPHLSEELLPMTFRNLVINDLIDEIGVPLTQVLNDMDWRIPMKEKWRQLSRSGRASNGKSQYELLVETLERAIRAAQPTEMGSDERTNEQSRYGTDDSTPSTRLKSETARVVNLALAVHSTSRVRNARQAFPPSQILDVYGAHAWAQIVCTAWRTFVAEVENKSFIHYPDVQNFLQTELNASYELMKLDPETQDLWRECEEQLVKEIHGRNRENICAARKRFEEQAKAKSQNKSPELTTTLAWTIVVDSALLNQQLIEDMKTAPVSAGCHVALPQPAPGFWPKYFLPFPSPEDRQAFTEYVRCRWPIHVFALDPEDDSQNIADSYSMRREMQLAISLAFVSGNLSANNMFQFARRLETDMETIALNKTMVGFSHGTDTFGWRFYPRFQSPDTENNFKVLFELLWGGPDRRHLLRQRQLEPGMRECVAIVLMPSFVPYVDVDASSNFFALDNPRRKLMNSRKAIRLGEQLRMIQNCSQFVGHAECCREGDIDRLLARSQQLESRLPLQSMSVQVPYENTLGGFAMFNTGVTDFAPELWGWYGTPAINLDAPTTLFLIGNHFSVHQTRVVIGGQEIVQPELLSRQVMKVTIPQNAIALIEKTGEVAGGWAQQLDPSEPKNAIDALAETKSPCPQDPADAKQSAAGKVSLEETVSDGPSGLVMLTSDASGSSTSGTGALNSIETLSSQSIYPPQHLVFPKNAIKLHDPAEHDPTLPPCTLWLKAANGIITLGGNLHGLSFVSGTNGSSSMTITGRLADLQDAVDDLSYAPSASFAGVDALTLKLQGSGVNSSCTVSVAIHVGYKWPDYLYVDVQLATPYGSTTHLLVPAAHLTASGSGPAGASSGGSSPAPAGNDVSIASAKSTAVSQPAWTTAQFTLGCVSKGVGIAACTPPSYTPNALTINLGTNYQTPPDNTVNLTFSLGSPANGKLPLQAVTLTTGTAGSPGVNWDPNSHVLTIAGQDLVNMTTNLMNVIQYQFGASRPSSPPLSSFTMSTTVTDFNNPNGFGLANNLTVNLLPVSQ